MPCHQTSVDNAKQFEGTSGFGLVINMQLKAFALGQECVKRITWFMMHSANNFSKYLFTFLSLIAEKFTCFPNISIFLQHKIKARCLF